MYEVSAPSVDQRRIGLGDNYLLLCGFAALLSIDRDVNFAALIEAT